VWIKSSADLQLRQRLVLLLLVLHLRRPHIELQKGG